jgi:hypothetical protein
VAKLRAAEAVQLCERHHQGRQGSAYIRTLGFATIITIIIIRSDLSRCLPQKDLVAACARVMRSVETHDLCRLFPCVDVRWRRHGPPPTLSHTPFCSADRGKNSSGQKMQIFEAGPQNSQPSRWVLGKHKASCVAFSSSATRERPTTSAKQPF